jgi:transcription termination/antitermination protein NusG
VTIEAAPNPWFAVWTRSRAEKSVYEQIVRKGYEVFLPTVTRWSRWKDRRKQVDWPLFPGYCFARFEPRDSLHILTVTGVAAIVSFDGRLAPIPDEEVEAIRRLVTCGLQYDPCPFIKEGDRVEVVNGPLKGVVGLLTKKGRHARLVLSVDLIGRAVAVTVDAADIKAY